MKPKKGKKKKEKSQVPKNTHFEERYIPLESLPFIRAKAQNVNIGICNGRIMGRKIENNKSH